MSKLACHGHNFKKGAVGGMDRHNRRLGKNHSNEEIDVERTHLNVTFKHTDNLYQDCKEEVERVKANGGRLRSDQNWLAEFTVYAPQTELSYEEYRRYFQEVHNFFTELVGDDNIKLSVVHMDEKTPHAHIDFMPLIRNENGEPVRLSSKEVMTRKFLTDIQNELPKRLKEHGFDVQRGDKVKVEDRPLKGRSAKQYKADMEREKAKLEKEIESLNHESLGKFLEIDEMTDTLRYLQKDIDRESAKLDEIATRQRECLDSLQKTETRLNEAHRALEEVLKHTDIIESGLKASYQLGELIEEVEGMADFLRDDYVKEKAVEFKNQNMTIAEKMKQAHDLEKSKGVVKKNISKEHDDSDNR